MSLPEPDPSQRTALDAAARGSVVVTGGPGTGKTTAAVQAVVQDVAAGTAPERVLLLAPTRIAAADLRDRVSLAVDRPTGVALVRTPSALAYSVLARGAARRGEPVPSLVSGAEQDVIIREMLSAHRSGLVSGPDWQGAVPAQALDMQAFRDELRNLMMRAAEADLQPQELASLGERAGRPEWVAGAAFFEEYQRVLRLGATPTDTGERYDQAAIMSRAADELHAQLEAHEPSPWDLFVVDDYQDATAATAALVDVVAKLGARVVLVGNADQTAQGFRGALPHGIADAARRLGAAHVELRTAHRQRGALALVTARVAERIGVAGIGSAREAGRAAIVGQADAVVEEGAVVEDDALVPSAVEVFTAPHEYSQSRAIAAQLRRARHGLDGEPIRWADMAVVARSRARLARLRSDLLAAEIPCESLGDGVALHQEPAVAPLLTILRVALGEPWTEESVLAVLASRLIGLDPVGQRRLRRELLREERAGGGTRSSSELLLDAMGDPGRLASLRGPEARLAARAAAAAAAGVERAGKATPTPGAVIWAVWEALGVADEWRRAATEGSARDDADLDAIIAVLRAAQTFTERLPTASAAAFVEYLEAQDFAADTLGARGAPGDAVAFVTPASAAGREWELVVIAGLDEGVWPNLRLRDSVLGSQRLAEALAAGPAGAVERASGDRDLRQARREVLDDETRSLLVAVSRARSRLIVTAISDAEQRPSRFVPLIEAAAGVEARDVAAMPVLADLRGVVARLRADGTRTLASASADGEHSVGPIADALARLAALGETTANPAAWYGVAEPSVEEGFWDDDARVRVSPSRYDLVRECPLRWALETVGGTREASSAQSAGLLVHAIAEKLPHGTEAQLLAEFDELWGDQGPTWAERVEYQKVRSMVVKLAGYLGTRGDAEVRTESRFAVELGRAVVAGSADRVEVEDGAARIVDLKTGAPIRAADAPEHGQLKLYQLAANHGGFEGVAAADGASLVFLGGAAAKQGTVVTQQPIDDAAVQRELADVVDVMTGAGFAACINDHCQYCPVMRSCPAQARGAQVGDR